MRYRFALLTCLCALACALPSAAAARLTVGISDSTGLMFSQPNFQRLHVTTARITVPWNTATMRNKSWLNHAQAWLKSAKADGVNPLVSFDGNGNYIPTVGQYGAAVKAFMHRFPQVHLYTAWNEPDWIYRSLSRRPLLAASYFNTLSRYCHHCTVLAGDVYLPASQLGPWIRAYRRGLRGRPAGWALHNYNDVRSHTTSQLRTLLRLTSGPVWLTEISGVERRGHWNYPNQNANAANRDERFLFDLAKRFPRVTHIYHYQWQATRYPLWDSGLVDGAGNPRPAYYTVLNAIRGRLP